MKKIIAMMAFISLFGVLNSQTSQTLCAGSSFTLQAQNPQNLTNVSYSVNPGGLTNNSGTWIVNPTTTTTYSVYTTGMNSSSVVVTTSAAITVSVFAQPSSAPTVTLATCSSSLTGFNLNISFFPASPQQFVFVNWNTIPNNVFSTSQAQATGVGAGIYTATISTNAGCSTVSAFTITPSPQPAVFNLHAPSGYVVNCYNPTLTVTATPSTNTYGWTNGSANFSGAQANLTSAHLGTWTVTASHPSSGCTASQTFALTQNTATPTSTLMGGPLLNITCQQMFPATVSVIATPSTNVHHEILSPLGGLFVANSFTTIYSVGAPGTYTHAAVNSINGCKVFTTFTVTSTSAFPTYSLMSPQNFTLGCNTKSVISVNIINAASTPMPGGPVSYTLIGPPTSTTIPAGQLNSTSVFTINVPGTWTVIVKDNTNNCESRAPFAVLMNTVAPHLSVIVPRQLLDCKNPSVALEGFSNDLNVDYQWSFIGAPSVIQGNTIAVNANITIPTQTIVNAYTLTVTDLNSTCKSSTVVPMYQNLFPPKANVAGNNAITCLNPVAVLANMSSSGIPPGTFPMPMPVIGYLWEGPSILPPVQLSTTYSAFVPGTYTFTALDLNNGCTSKTIAVVNDNRNYPMVSSPPQALLLPCPGIATISPLVTGPLVNCTYSWIPPSTATVLSVNSSSLVTASPGLYYLIVTNVPSGCATTASIHLHSCVGIKKEDANFVNLRGFPNPGNGLFQLVSDTPLEKGTVEVYNNVGVLIKKQEFLSTETLLNLQNEANGMYILRVLQNTTLIYTSKLLKE